MKKMPGNILLVEDDIEGRTLMSEAFKFAQSEMQLEMVANGTEALQYLRQEEKYVNKPQPDLILLDLNLPGKNGIEVMDEIQKNIHFQNIPIVILTGSTAPGDIQACSKFRCKYVLKPSRFHELIELVKSLPEFC